MDDESALFDTLCKLLVRERKIGSNRIMKVNELRYIAVNNVISPGQQLHGFGTDLISSC